MVIKDRGLTARLGGGLVYAGRPLPMGDLKWACFRRYSLTAGIPPEFGGLGLSRHIDDRTPFQNLDVVGPGGVGWQGDRRFGAGLRVISSSPSPFEMRRSWRPRTL